MEMWKTNSLQFSDLFRNDERAAYYTQIVYGGHGFRRYPTVFRYTWQRRPCASLRSKCLPQTDIRLSKGARFSGKVVSQLPEKVAI
jgi:hypothetical protein